MRVRRAVAATMIGAGLLGLAACAAEPEPQPVFASDAEALAAAEETYERYLSLSAQYLAGDDVESALFALLSPNAATLEREALADLQDSGYHQRGELAATGFLLESRRTVADGAEQLQVAVCVDVSEVEYIDSTGAPVDLGERSPTYPLVVTFVAESSDLIRVDRQDPAEGESTCD